MLRGLQLVKINMRAGDMTQFWGTHLHRTADETTTVRKNQGAVQVGGAGASVHGGDGASRTLVCPDPKTLAISSH